MAKENSILAANQNGDVAEKISGDTVLAGYNNEVDAAVVQAGSALQTMFNRAQQFKTQQAQNDNNDGGDDTPPSTPTSTVIEDIVEDNEGNSYQVYIDVDEVAKRTHFSKNQLMELCSGTSTAVAIPTDFTELSTFIIVNQGASETAKKLAKKKKLPSELRLYFLRKAQEYG